MRGLALGLDMFDLGLAEQMMEDKQLPVLSELFGTRSFIPTMHGDDTRTGLAWEHFSSGKSASELRRRAAVRFDPETYGVSQTGGEVRPYLDVHGLPVLYFDAPYVPPHLVENGAVVAAWGAHDPGTHRCSNPPELHHRLEAAFGPHPGAGNDYRIVWPSQVASRRFGEAMQAGASVRADALIWLVEQVKLPYAVAVFSETHSSNEAFWHGVSPTHPLRSHPNAAQCGHLLKGVYRSIDASVGKVLDALSPTDLCVFSPGGAADNRTDLPSMVFTAEVLARRYGRGRVRGGLSMVGPDQEWSRALQSIMRLDRKAALRRSAGLLRDRVRGQANADLRWDRPGPLEESLPRVPPVSRVSWQPSSWYASDWPTMDAFALPSFYDGQVRVNLRGREAAGTVTEERYDNVVAEVEELFHALVNPDDGRPVVEKVERRLSDPFAAGPFDADLIVVWNCPSQAVEHPTLGRIGPIPYRRMGGHRGEGFVLEDRSSEPSPSSLNFKDLVMRIGDRWSATRPAELSA